MKENEQPRKNTQFYQLAPILFGLIFVMSGWGWSNLPESIETLLWLLSERGVSMWLLTSLIYLSKEGFNKDTWKKSLVEFFLAGIGYFIATRVGYGSLLRDIQWEGPLTQKVWGWSQAILLGVSWGVSAVFLLLLINKKFWYVNKKKILLSMVVLAIGGITDLILEVFYDNPENLGEYCWTLGVIGSALILATELDKDSKKLLLVNIIICVIFFIIGALITSYFEPPANMSVDRHKIAELTWGLGMGLGINYIMYKKYDQEVEE